MAEVQKANNISIGLLGLGVVGSGVIKLIEDNREEFHYKLGCNVRVKSVLVRNMEKDRDISVDPELLTTDPDAILNDPDIDIIVEVMGGVDEAYAHIKNALQRKKHVITANKDLIALHGQKLQEIASQNHCDLYYEASVGGGIPLLRGIYDGLVSDRIQEVIGIVNGTTNYILTKMDEEGVAFHDALAEAQKLGFAEADPTADVEGLDAARKMAILARLSFSTHVELEDVKAKGITDISLADLQFGKQLGYTMKLLGYAKSYNGSMEVSVEPTFVSIQHPLAGVKNEYNAVFVKGEAVGQTMFFGPGAGSLPTATAVLSDVMATVKNMRLGVNGKGAVLPRHAMKLTPPDEQLGKFYVRLHVKDEVGAFASISQLFHNMDISFERILQTPVNKYEIAEIILVTHQTSLAKFQETLVQLKEMEVVETIESSYRVEGDVK